VFYGQGDRLERRGDRTLADRGSLGDDPAEVPPIDEDVARQARRVTECRGRGPGGLESHRELTSRPRERTEDRVDRLWRRDVGQDLLLRPGRCG
jgi:hypothetical protein